MTSHFDRIAGPILCLVTDLERAGGEARLIRCVSDAVRGGVNMVQVRAHHLSDDSLAELAASIVSEVGDDALVVVNGPPGIARSSGTQGVHLRENIPIDRSAIGAGLLVGQSVHSIESAMRAEKAGADYIILGTVFPSASHPGGTTGGAKLVRSVADAVSIPVIGIGGITVENAAEVISAGASGIAVIGAIIRAQNTFDAAHTLREAMDLRKQS